MHHVGQVDEDIEIMAGGKGAGMQNARFGLSVAVAWIFLILMMASPLPVQAANIPWDNSKRFDATFNNEDVAVVLRKILDTAGVQVSVKPEVTAKVSRSFISALPQAAFNQLIDENGLSWEYNPQTNTATISFIVKEDVQFVSLTFVSPEQIREAIRKINEQGYLISGTIVFEPANKLAVLKGTPTQLSRLQDLIARLEAGEKARQNDQASLLSQNARAQNDAAEADKKAAEAQLSKEQAEQLRQQRLDVEQIAVKVIPLHYASVGPVRIKFQGEDVTVPGLISSLKTVLGVASPSGGSEGLQETPQLRTIVTAPVAGSEQSFGLVSEAPRRQATANSTMVLRQDPNQFRGTVSEDTRTNSVVVRGTPREITQVEELVKKLDKPLEQIEIEAMIVVANKGVSEELGVKWAGEQSGSADGRTVGGALVGPAGASIADVNTTLVQGLGTATTRAGTATSGTSQSLISPLSLMSSTSTSGTMANFVFRGARSALTAQLNALSQDNRAQVLSAPRVVTLDNLAAKITDDRSAYLTTSGGVGTSGSLVQIKAGLTLNITPSLLRRDDLGEDNLVRLVIEAENTNVEQGVNNALTKTGNQVQTQVIIPDGSTFVMGGLVSDSRKENEEGIPLLQDIPLLGALFTVRTSNHANQEALFFITPRLVPRAELYARDVAMKRYLQEQRSDLEQIRADLRDKSQLIAPRSKAVEEEE